MRVGISALFAALLVAGCGSTTDTGENVRKGSNVSVDAAGGTTCPGGECCTTLSAQGLFTFLAPCSITGGPGQGIDSQVGRYAGDGIVIDYDYGGYSSPLTELKEFHGYAREDTVVDGLAAEIVTAHDPSDALAYLAGIVFPEVQGPYLRLTMLARTDGEPRRDLATQIFRTIDFP